MLKTQLWDNKTGNLSMKDEGRKTLENQKGNENEAESGL